MPDNGEQPGEHKWGMFRLHVSVGVVAALVPLGVWAWTPMKAAYWEWQVRLGEDGPITPDRQEAIKTLFQMGPRAQPALERLLSCPYPNIRREVAKALDFRLDDGDLPLIAKAAASQDPEVSLYATSAAQKVPVREVDAGRVKPFNRAGEFLDWREREGRAKYGEGGK